MTSGIELRAALAIRAMQRDDFVAYEVVSWLQACWNSIIYPRVWSSDERRDGPLVLEPWKG
jgi:hypothetical protein